MQASSSRPFPYRTPPELSGGRPHDAPVVIVGAGPVGLSAAIDLALHGIATIVLDDNDVVSVGSRAICWSKRTLEIFDRLGVGDRMIEKGVTWQVGRLFHRTREVYAFDLLPEPGHKMPAFINLQQYYVESYLVDRAMAFPDLIDLRWKNRVTNVAPRYDHAVVTVATQDGTYQLQPRFVVACDGARSPTRSALGLDFDGQVFEERFLIADVKMTADFPSERWFWFEPPFHQGQSALLHKQPDAIYRIDLQLGWDTDPDIEKDPDRVTERIVAMVGHRDFTLDWVSVYTFQCRRLAQFVHGPVIFAGDSAHVVSPFGARGGNGGIQDIDNLCWKLAAVLKGVAPPNLVESYDTERGHGADENIRNSSRSTRFMTPKSATERSFRDAVLDLATDQPFARRLVNSGRLSQPCNLAASPLQTPSAPAIGAAVAPGSACVDAPIDGPGAGWMLNRLGGQFLVLTVTETQGPAKPLPLDLPELTVSCGSSPAADLADGHRLSDPSGLVASRYGTGWHYLIRPDQHVAARVPLGAVQALDDAHQRALGLTVFS